MINYLLIHFRKSQEDWCQTQLHKLWLWIPWLSLILTFLIYGLLELMYTSFAAKKHFHVGYGFTITCLVITALFTAFVLEYALYAQKHYVPVKAMSKLHWWLRIVIGILASWFLPAIVYVFFTMTFSVKTEAGANQAEIDKMAEANGSVKLYIMVMAILIGPIIEELLYRFMLIGPNRFGSKKYNVYLRSAMIIISTLLFAYAHLAPQLAVTNWHSNSSILVTTSLGLRYLVMGAVFTYIYVSTNDIRASITAHIGSNLISLLLI